MPTRRLLRASAARRRSSLFTSIGSTPQTLHGQTYNVQTAQLAWSAQKNANGAYRFETRSGDQWSQDSSTKERSELVAQFQLTQNLDYEIKFDLLLEPGTVNAAGGLNHNQFLLTGQLHATEDAGDISAAPIFGLYWNGDKLVIGTRSSTVDPLVTSPNAVSRYADASDYGRGVWRSHRYIVRIEPTGGGRLTGWIDGVQVVDLNNIPIGYVDAVGPYWKIGIYRQETSETLAVQFRNTTVALAS